MTNYDVTTTRETERPARGAMTRDYRELVIEMLADSEAALIERVVGLTIERDSHRLLAQHAIHFLHTQHVELKRLREQHSHLLHAYRQERRAARERRSAA